MINIETAISKAMVLNKEIINFMELTGYLEWGNLEEVEIDTDDPQQIFLGDQLKAVLMKLEDVNNNLQFLSSPIQEESGLHVNEDGRYETDGGHVYNCGSIIEMLIEDPYWDAKKWCRTTVEYKDDHYYLVHFPHVDISSIRVRVRG